MIEDGELKATYTYNALGQRTRKVTATGTTVYHYDLNGQLLSETQADGRLIRDYIRVNGIARVQIDAGERLSYLHSDHLATPRLATDNSGRIVWRWEGEAFGGAAVTAGVEVEINLRFPGQYFDQETGWFYNWNRYYDPSTGRYITSDPIGLAGGLNTYAYVGANPLLYTDPLGLAYSPQGEHGIPRNGGGKAPNACGCLDKALGLDTLVGSGLAAGGQPISPKRFTQRGTSSGTSPISKGLSKAFPQRLPFNVPVPTTKRPGAKSNIVGRILGRWAPFVG